MARLKRKSLSEQLAIAITNEVKLGTLSGLLPGYRELEKRYDVSRRTCEGATKILEANRVIGRSEPGKMRPILQRKTKKRTATKLRLLVVTDSLHQASPLDAALVTEIENFWKIEHGEVNRVECDLMRVKKPDSRLRGWLKAPGADCLLFETMPPQWVKSVDKLEIPCYGMGGSVAESKGGLSGSGFKLPEHIGKELRKLLDLEHRRILLVLGQVTHELMRSKIHQKTAQILAKDWGPEEVSLSVNIPDLQTPGDWLNWWKKALLRERPTVVLTDSVYLGLSLHNFCLDQGIQMPRDLSMVVFDDAEFFTWLTPSPTRYRYRKDQAFRHFRSWVRGGFVPGSLKYFSAESIKGQTLAEAHKVSRRK